MKAIKYFLALTVLFTLPGFAHAQGVTIVDDDGHPIIFTGEWLDPYFDQLILDSMRVKYTQPDGFEEINMEGAEATLEGYPGLQKIIAVLEHQLYSDDGEFIASFPLYMRPYTEEEARYYFDDPTIADRMHEDRIKSYFSAAYGDEIGNNWRKYVHYYSAEKAKRIFNADTAIRFQLLLKPEDYYKGKYNNLEILMIQKMGRSFINIFCLYTDKAKKKLPYYWNKMEGIFRYED